MRVLTKMTAATAAAGIILFGSWGWYLIRAEHADLERAIEREAQLVGRSLRHSVGNALRDRQVADVRAVLDAVEALDSSVDLTVYGPDGDVLMLSQPNANIPAAVGPIVRRAASTQQAVLQYDPPGDPSHLMLAVPLGPEAAANVLLLVRPLDDLAADLYRTRNGILLSALLFVIVTTGLGVALGSIYIQRPLARLFAAIQQVRSGDLESRVPVQRRDEFGNLAEQFNAMLVELRDAQSRLRVESESRAQLQQHLEHADKLITVGQLSAGLAHEIGSPLQVVNGRARALHANPHDVATTRRIAGILVEQTDRITRIVDQLVRYSRHRPVQFARIHATTPVRAVLALLEDDARRRGIDLALDADPNLPPLLADADQLQQVVLNLVRNALDATPPGGAVRVDLRRGHGGGTNSATMRLVVTDSGKGIAPSIRNRLFDPFFTTRRGTGTGLGLAVVKWIVTAHGGQVSASPAKSGGTTFLVELPLDGPIGAT